MARTILINGTLVQKRDANKHEKHFQKMYRDVVLAVPKTTETRCRDGSVQGRHVIQRLTPSLHLFFGSKIALPSNLVA